MAHMNLNGTRNRYADYTTTNRIFLSNISKSRKQSQHLDFKALKDKLEKVTQKLALLSPVEREEWVEIHEIKIKQLFSMFPERGGTVSLSKQQKLQQYGNALRQALHTLIGVCEQLKIEYKSDMIANIIQEFYFYQYKEESLHSMEEAGYQTGQFKVLHYEESSFFNLCCCWEPSSRVE